MSEDQVENKSWKMGKHYSEFSLDEFTDSYPINALCNALNKDRYGFKLSLRPYKKSLDSLNKFLEVADFYDKIFDKKGDLNWSADTKYLIRETFDVRLDKKPFLELDYGKQIDIKRLNRLLLEETYPKETPKSSKYFIPPGLINTVNTFEYHYKIANGEPILIIGQTGVGKSLFLHIYERLYREENEDEIKYPLIKVNCAHLSGGSSMVRSELFGYVKGAFTGAITNKKGYVEMADSGVLILEEIGDLPPDTQAALLTFIETGEYYPVGYGIEPENKKKEKEKQNIPSTSASVAYSAEYPAEYADKQADKPVVTNGGQTPKSKKASVPKEQILGPKKASVQIVGLTNRPDNMRDDLRHRFFPFYVPPIHKRRTDILYYLYSRYPSLIGSLRPYEILILMTYHWPGNVREIETVGRLLRRNVEQTDRTPVSPIFDEQLKSDIDSVRLYFLDLPPSSEEFLEGNLLLKIIDDLTNNGIDVDLIDSILSNYGVGLREKRALKPFFNLYPLRLKNNFIERYGLRFTYYLSEFDHAYKGIETLFNLFYQTSSANINLFNLADKQRGFSFVGHFNKDTQCPDDKKVRYDKLEKSIFEFLSGIKLQDTEIIPKDIDKRKTFFSMLGKLHPGNHFLASLGFTEPMEGKEKKAFDLSSLKLYDLLKLYYQTILDRTQGNQTKAAQLAGLKYQTFRDELERYRIEAGRKNQTGLKLSV